MFIFIFVFVFVLDAPVTEEKKGDNLARLLSWSIGKNSFEGTERKKERKKTEKISWEIKVCQLVWNNKRNVPFKLWTLASFSFFAFDRFEMLGCCLGINISTFSSKTISYFFFSFYDLGYEEKGSIGEKNI